MKALRFCIFILTLGSCSVGEVSSERNYISTEPSDTSVRQNLTPMDSAQQIKISKGNQKNSILNPSKSKRKKGL
jgi:hypothetical protein